MGKEKLNLNTIELVEFFNKYDQKYVQLLLDSKESAKKLDYPSNHKFKYCYRKLLDLKWE